MNRLENADFDSDDNTAFVGTNRTGAFDVARWLAHFERNRQGRTEPNWRAPITLPFEVIKPLLASLEQFQLGDGGGPAYLIARDREKFLSGAKHLRRLVDLWFEEEKEHSRLLGGLVARFGGTPIAGHWSFTAFCACRRILGVQFELTVLLLTEISSTAYYRLLRRYAQDEAVRQVCKLILRDEAGHIRFHCDRLASVGGSFGPFWVGCFRMLGACAATMLWVNHASAIRAIGGGAKEFYRELHIELTRFIRALRRGSARRGLLFQPALEVTEEVASCN